MSDSDDTDFLLLIPPDFFLVDTPDLDDVNSEDDFELDNHQLVKPSVVNDLITHVNELETRISLIENLDSSQLPTIDNTSFDLNQSNSEYSHQTKILFKHCNDNFNTYSMSSSLRMLSGSVDGIQQNHCLKNKNDFVSPPRHRQPFSLPSTPTHGEYNKSQFNSSKINYEENTKTNLGDHQGTESLTTNEKQIIVGRKTNDYKDNATFDENQTVPNTIPKVFPEEKELLGEIDQYLNDVEKHGGIFQNKRDNFHSVPLTAPFQSKKDTSIENDYKAINRNFENPSNSKTHNEILHLDLPEVDKLLKEMEATQNEIEQKLKLHNPPKRILNASPVKHSHYSQIREKTDSLPDSGISSKEIYSGNSGKNIDVKNFPSAIQESFVRRNMLLSNENDSTTETNDITDSLMQQHQSPASRRRLDMDVKYKDIANNYKSHNQNINRNYMPISDLPITEDTSVKATQVFESQNQQPNIHKHFSPTKFSISKHVGLESLRDKFNNERDKRLQSQETSKYYRNSQKSVYNSENNHSTSHGNKRSDLEYHQGSRNDRQNAYGDHEKQPIESVTYPLEQKQSSTNLLSLTDLWNKEPVFHSDDPNKLKQKLEEEKYRRQHCEEMIQTLQYRVLEEQEKLAVAVRVDQEKDKAIIQLTDAWRKLVKHWGELEEQRHCLAQELQAEKNLNKTKFEEMSKKINRWEIEVAQALDLAAGYKEKCESITKERDSLKEDLQARIEDAEKEIKAVSEQNQQFLKERNEMKQQIEENRRKHEEDKHTINVTQAELSEAKKQLSQCDAEINVMMEQKQALSEKLKDEKAHNNTLEQQKVGLQQALDEARKKEKAAQDEARMYGERIEVARTELRALYQGQLEAVVKDKLREFQSQLDASEAALKAELLSREKLWAEKANNHCKLLLEKHKAEVQQIQSQHRDELKAWRLKVIDCERLKALAESQLKEETDRRTDIAQRLHSVMETQWRQTLKIITNPNAVDNNAHTTNSFEHATKHKQHQEGEKTQNSRLDMKGACNESSSVASVVQSEDFPFGEEGRATYRTATNSQPQQDQLKKYIQMLLARAPGNPVDGSELSGLLYESSTKNPPLSPGSSFGGKWSAFMPLQDDKKTNNALENNAGQSHNKPPWK